MLAIMTCTRGFTKLCRALTSKLLEVFDENRRFVKSESLGNILYQIIGGGQNPFNLDIMKLSMYCFAVTSENDLQMMLRCFGEIFNNFQ